VFAFMSVLCYSLVFTIAAMTLKLFGLRYAAMVTDCYFVASCYHPPKPKYSVDDFVAQLSSTIEDIIDREVNPVFVITGDFNLLCTEFLEEKFGFDQLVQTSTHGNNILDKVFTNRLIYFKQLCITAS